MMFVVNLWAFKASTGSTSRYREIALYGPSDTTLRRSKKLNIENVLTFFWGEKQQEALQKLLFTAINRISGEPKHPHSLPENFLLQYVLSLNN